MKPYTYLIGWKQHDVWYYGVRFAKNCDPDELWVTYFTSSKHVKEFRCIYGEPDVIQVRMHCRTKQLASNIERKVLLRIKRSGNWNKWLNKGIAGAHYGPHTPEAKLKMSLCQVGRVYKKRNQETYDKISKALTGKSLSEEHKLSISKSHFGNKRSLQHKQNISKGLLGGKRSDETKTKMSNSAKNREIVSCPHCNKIGSISQMKRWHFDNCKIIAASL